MIDGKHHVLEYPIHADLALIAAERADRWGNLVYRKTARNFGPIMAMAARCTVAQVHEVVELGGIDPEHVVTPGLFVKRVVQVPTCGDPAGWFHRAATGGLNMQKLTRDQLAARVARDIFEGAVVNLGIGLPTLVANHLPHDREILLHTENGLLGMGPSPAEGHEDYDLINAGKQPVTALPGASFFHHADSFAMMRGGHLDICVLGAFQVSERGDLANWHTGAPDAIPAVGGAMDLAGGAKRVFVMMEHQTKDGRSKIVRECTYPLTGLACVSRIYTDLAVIDVTPQGLRAVEWVAGLDLDGLVRLTGLPVQPP